MGLLPVRPHREGGLRTRIRSSSTIQWARLDALDALYSGERTRRRSSGHKTASPSHGALRRGSWAPCSATSGWFRLTLVKGGVPGGLAPLAAELNQPTGEHSRGVARAVAWGGAQASFEAAGPAAPGRVPCVAVHRHERAGRGADTPGHHQRPVQPGVPLHKLDESLGLAALGVDRAGARDPRGRGPVAAAPVQSLKRSKPSIAAEDRTGVLRPWRLRGDRLPAPG